MTVDRTQEIVGAYLDALLNNGDFGQYMAEDVAMKVMETGQEIRGRREVVAAIVAWHQTTFEAHLEVVDMIVGDGKGGAEMVFVGTQKAEFAGIPSSGKGVRVPYTAFYSVSNGKISELRLYGIASGLMMQLTTDTAEAIPA
jgi:steroid delta-isomerase-like uncharacterized protein